MVGVECSSGVEYGQEINGQAGGTSFKSNIMSVSILEDRRIAVVFISQAGLWCVCIQARGVRMILADRHGSCQ